MLDTVQRYVHGRRQGLVRFTAFAYGSYAITTYISARLEEVKDKMLRTRVAKDNLRRRFQSTHDGVCFTIMALIPTLASQILEEMDVEALTNELQSLSNASRSRASLSAQNSRPSQSVSDLSAVSDVASDAGERLSGSEGSIALVPLDPPVQQLSSSIISIPSGSEAPEDSLSMPTRTKSQLWNEVKILALTRTLTILYTITLLSLLTAVQLNLLGRSRYIDSVRTSDRAEREHEQQIINDDEEDGKSDAIPEETELRFLILSWWVLHVGWKDVAARVRSSVESVFNDVSLKNKLSPSEFFTLIMDVRRRVETDEAGSKLSTRFISSLLPPTPETTAHVLAQGGALGISRDGATSGSFEPPVEAPYDGLSRATAIPIESPRPRLGTFPTPPPSSHDPESDLSSWASQSPPGTNSLVEASAAIAPLPPTLSGIPESLAVTSSLSSSASHAALDMDPQFTVLLAQTRRYLSGPDFAYALGCALDRATEVLMDGLRARVFVDTSSAVNANGSNANESQTRSRGADDVEAGTVGGGGGSFENEKRDEDEVRVRLAGMLPGLAKWSQLALNATPNELVDNIMAVREVSALEAVIISDYGDRFPAVS